MAAAFDLVVRNGTVVSAEGRDTVDIGVCDGRIARIDRRLPAGTVDLDASGQLVLPGAIDSHCHVAQRSSTGLMTADDFESATRAAACGGTTTIIPFAAQHRGQPLREVVDDYRRSAEGKAIVDYGFHLIVSDPDERALTVDLPALIREGCTSFKVFMTYEALKLTDRQILDVLQVAREQQALVLVHAENHDAVAWSTARLMRAGHTAPKFHAAARPDIAEREAVHRMISLSEVVGAAVLVVHVSGDAALEQIRWARGRGLPIFAETCPQYLCFTEASLDRPGFEGAKFIFSPPPRTVRDQQALWRGCARGDLDVMSSDHAPYRFGAVDGKAVHGTDAPFPKVPNGMPGLETCLPVVFSEGVVAGRLTLEQFVALSSTNAARIYGMHPRKGTLAVGADADIAIWDPERRVTITNDRLHHHMDYTPYEGMTVTGWPVVTVSRGDVLWREGVLTATPGRGRFLARDRFTLGLPAALRSTAEAAP